MRHTFVTVRVTDKESEDFGKAAKLQGFTKSQALRAVIRAIIAGEISLKMTVNKHHD